MWIARAMAQTGDWVTPRLYGRPWFEKPALYYWTAAIGFELHLSPEWAARLPSAVAALVCALSIAWLGFHFIEKNQFCPWHPGLLAALLFSTSVGSIGFARAATPDMLFAASITLAMASAAVILRRAGALRGSKAAATAMTLGTTGVNAAIFGVFLGLAVLAKGPAGVVLAAGALGIWAVATKSWAPALRLLHPCGIVSFGIVTLPWYVLCARRNPDFVRVFIYQHNFERYLSPVFQHRQPFWFFVPITLLAILPWTAFLLPVIQEGRARHDKSWRDSSALFFACWAVFPILFFSCSQSKLPSYILPGIPALALVTAISLAEVIEHRTANTKATFILLGLTWIGLGVAGSFWLRRLPRAAALQMRPDIFASIAAVIAGGIAILLLAPRRPRAGMWIALVLVSSLVEFAGIAILPKLDPYYSARSVGTMLQGDRRPDRLFVYGLPRAWEWGVDFYLGRELHEWSPDDHAAALVLTTPKGFAALKNDGYFRGNLVEPYEGVFLVPIRARPYAANPRE